MVFDALPEGARAFATVLLVALFVASSALVAAAEAAILAFPRARRRDGEPLPTRPGAARVEALLEHPQRVILTAGVAVTTLNTAAAAVAAVAARDALPGRPGLVLALVVGAGSLVLFTLTSVVPRGWGHRRAAAVAPIVAGGFAALSVVLRPVVALYLGVSGGLLRLAGESESQTGAYASEEELKTLITIGAEEGILEEEQEEMIHSVLELDETTAKEIMVPRPDVVAVPADATLLQIKAYVLDAGYSRLPVYQGTVDNVVGIVLLKDMLLRLLEDKGHLHVRDLMKEPLFVPETKKLDDLLAEMRERSVHVAIVVDEFGAVTGLVTFEDVIEEIVGEIRDEYDLSQEPVRRVDPTTAIVDARLHVEEVNAELGTLIPIDGPYDTVAGYVVHRLGRIGREGETVRAGAQEIVVDKIAGRRITRVKILNLEPPQDDDGDEARAPRHAEP